MRIPAILMSFFRRFQKTPPTETSRMPFWEGVIFERCKKDLKSTANLYFFTASVGYFLGNQGIKRLVVR